jgi:hypothetical protein
VTPRSPRRRGGPGAAAPAPAEDSLGILLLPGTLEGFALEAHARSLLDIPRVIALEPSRFRTPRLLRDAAALRQARKLRFPGQPRLAVLYHPAQYPLARALMGQHDVELWYIAPAHDALQGADRVQVADLAEFDELAREHAAQTIVVAEDGHVPDEPLRARLRELDVINPYAFLPGTQPGRR